MSHTVDIVPISGMIGAETIGLERAHPRGGEDLATINRTFSHDVVLTLYQSDRNFLACHQPLFQS